MMATASACTTMSRGGSIPNKHRVLIYTTCYNVLDGVTLTIRKLEAEILAAGHSVCVLSTASGDPANANLDGSHPNRRIIYITDAMPIPFVHDPQNPELTYHVGFALSPQVKTEIADFDPSIIHITVPDCSCLHLIHYARVNEIPIMGTYHSNYSEYLDHYAGVSWLKHIIGAFFRHQYNFIQALYVPTPFIQRQLISNFKLDSATDIRIWGRGVDINTFHPDHRSYKYRHNLGISDDTPIVCWAGRLVPEKRPDIFLKVIKRLNASGVKFHALVVGVGPCEDDFKSLPNTTFAGWMTPQQLAVAYASSDIFFFSSSVETFGNVTLEAAASGLPVVVEASCSGHLVAREGELHSGPVRQGKNGFACHRDDPEAFYEATVTLVVNDKLRKSCSLASRELALTMEKSAVVRGMLDNYTEVTDQFYTEYGGHHANRDAVYRKPDSFVAGNHPRPTLFVLVEYLGVLLFYLIWNMSTAFVQMQESLMASIGLGYNSGVVEEQVSLQSVLPAPAPMKNRNLVTKTPAPVESSAMVIQGGNNNVEMEDYQDDDLYSVSSGFSSDGDDDLSVEEDEDRVQQQLSICSSMRERLTCDTPISHVLAITLIWIIQWQCRMESHFRNTVSNCCSPAMRFTLKRKRSFASLKDISSKKHDDSSRLVSAAPLQSECNNFVEGQRMRQRQAADPLLV